MSILPLTPRTSDGKPIYLPSIFPGGVNVYYAGCGDHSTNGRGEGDTFAINSDSGGDTVVEFGFNDWTYIAGGGIRYANGMIGDWMSILLFAPASPTTAASGTGNCNIINGVIVPAAGNGAFNVDLSLAVPIPSFDEDNGGEPSGYWDWDEPAVGRGSVVPSASPGSAKWHLLAVPVNLARFAAKFPLLGAEHVPMTVPAVKPKKVLPQWRYRVTLRNSGHANLQISWYLVLARTKTL